MLRESDATSPAAAGAASTWPPPRPAPGRDWTDDGTARQARGLKHRAQHETRSIPIPPVLVQLLRAHLKRYGTSPDGRIFRTARGGILQDSAYSADWACPPGSAGQVRQSGGDSDTAGGRFCLAGAVTDEHSRLQAGWKGWTGR